MVLRLVPYAMRPDQEEGDKRPAVVVNYSANLDPLPAGAEITDLPDPPSAGLPGAQLQPLVVEVVVQPMVTSDENGNDVLTFAVDARLPHESAGGQEQAVPQASTWMHDLDSAAVKDRVSLVRNAAPEDRYQRLLELADAMMAPLDSKE